MRARREPAAPPEIPGFEYVGLLGLGGFADVFEYRQELPRRSVAVKVLLASSLDGETRERFFAEANLMAQLSHHPSIVTIYHADIAADGRPFLVMEYCSRPGLGSRYRSERISVEETLRTGVRLASAVEAAHRQGILHRDIKPANILTTDYGWPALTDFGIAATTSGDSSAGTGMSIPWSPPELLAEDPVGDERGDVYSLAATIYSMLAGRSPFEVVGQSNGPADLISRIERSPLPRIDRDDVPAGLEAVLARAMSKDPARRYPTALAIAQALVQVERSLGLSPTSVDLSEDLIENTIPRTRSATGAVAEGRTRVRPIVSIDPAQHVAVPGGGEIDDDATRVRPITSVSAQDTEVAAPVLRRSFVTPPPRPEGADLVADSVTAQSVGYGLPDSRSRRRGSGRRRRLVSLGVAGFVVIGGLAAAAVFAGRDDPGTAPEPTSGGVTTNPPLTQGAVPAPTDLVGVNVSGDRVRFTWQNPDPQEGDQYVWHRVGVGVSQSPELTAQQSVVVAKSLDGAPVCIEVSIVRADRRASAQPVQGCSP